LAETIPYANIIALLKKQEPSRLPILRRDYLELEYRTSNGKVLTAKLSPAMMDGFVTQLGDRMRHLSVSGGSLEDVALLRPSATLLGPSATFFPRQRGPAAIRVA